MPPAPLDPFAGLSLRDRLKLLAFEARLAGLPESVIQAGWEALDGLDVVIGGALSRQAIPTSSG